MPVAAMANPPEHDFAPSWLKIPTDNQLVGKAHSDHRAGSKYPSQSDAGRQRSRHPSGESSYPGYLPRHLPQQPSILGYSSRDDKRYRSGQRYHSLDDPLRHSDLPSAYAPLQNGFMPPPHSLSYFPSSMEYQYPHPHHHGKRGGGGSPLHGYHGRSNNYGGGVDQGRGRYSGGGGGGGRHGHGGMNGKAGPENGESGGLENGGGGGRHPPKGDVGGGKGGEDGKSKSEESALSSHDFPSLSGDGDEMKNESSKPVGAWEKRPETARINIGGKKLQLVQKTTAGDTPTTNTAPAVAGKMMSSPSGGVINGVSNLSSSVGAKGSTTAPLQAVQGKGPKGGRCTGAVPLSSSGGSSSVYKSLVPKTPAPNKATTPRKPLTKEVVMRPAPVISSKEKSTPPLPSSSSSSSSSSTSSSSASSSSSLASPGGSAPSQSPSPAPVKEQASPRATPAMDIPTPRMVTGKVKRTDKMDFLKELRRSGSVDSPRQPAPPPSQVNGVAGDNHPSYYRSSTKQHYERTNSATTIYQQPDPFEDADADEHSITNNQHQSRKCNGYVDNEVDDDEEEEEESNVDNNRRDLVMDNGHIEILQKDKNHLDCQPMQLSSSLEAEKRLLQEMGWHEHSDNEEGYAPITEDELKEFKLRSQQMKKNGLSRPQPVILNLVPNPVIAMTTMVIEDTELSSSSDTSDDEL